MNKEMFRGWKDVFSFTLIQTIKSKSIIITTLVLFLLCLLALPVYSFLNGGDTDDRTASSVEQIYVFCKEDQMFQGLERTAAEDPFFRDTNFTRVEDADQTAQQLEQEKSQEKAALLKMEYQPGQCSIKILYNQHGETGGLAVQDVADHITENYQKIILNGYQITGGALEMVEAPVESSVEVVSTAQDTENMEDTKENSMSLTMAQYYILLTILILIIFIISFSGEAVATSVVTEKSSKVIELLMTSIKPLAVILGKVLAMTCVVLLQFTVMAVGLGLSIGLSGMLMGTSGTSLIPSSITTSLSGMETGGFLVVRLILIILSLGVGILFEGFLAGLAGASISKMDELAEGIKGFTVFLILGAYGVIFLSIMGMTGSASRGLVYAATLFPLTSVFAIPGFLAIGWTPLWVSALGLVILAACTLLLLRFVSGVYEFLIYYSGSPLSFRKLIDIFRKNRGGKKLTKGGGLDE